MPISPSNIQLPGALASAALAAVENVLVITDRDGVILYVNPAFSEVTGYELDEVVGQTPRLLQSGMQDESFYTALWAEILAGRTWTGELVNRRRGGELYTDRMTITPLLDQAGDIAHFIAVKRDVSGHLAALTAGNPAGVAHIDVVGSAGVRQRPADGPSGAHVRRIVEARMAGCLGADGPHRAGRAK